MKNKRTIIKNLKAKYSSDYKDKNKDPLKNDSVAQEVERIRLENEVNNLQFKTPFGEINKEHFDEKFNLNDRTADYLKQKIEYHKVLKHHQFINNINNRAYLEAQPELVKLFDGFKSSKDAMAFVKENEEKLQKAFEVAEMFKPTIDKTNFSNSLEGVHSNLSHQPQGTKLKPTFSGYRRWEFDSTVDNKKDSPKISQYWVDDKTPIIVDGKGTVDRGV